MLYVLSNGIAQGMLSVSVKTMGRRVWAYVDFH